MHKYKPSRKKKEVKSTHEKMKTGYIYRLWSPGSQEFYIGSTINLHRRKTQHKSSCLKEGNSLYNCPVYQHIRANGGWDNWRLDVEHTVQFNARYELNQVEGDYIRRLKPPLNSDVAGRTKKEYKKYYDKKNKEKLAEKRKQHYQKNKEKRAEYKKQHYQTYKEKANKKYDCSCGVKYTFSNRVRHSKTQRHQKHSTRG